MGGDNGKKEPEASSAGFMALLSVAGMVSVLQAIGFGIAFAVFKFGATSVYSEKIAAVVAAGQAPVFAALVAIAFSIRLVNFVPMIYKEKVMKGAMRDELGANMRSNPFIYKAVGPSNETVLFQNDGVVGKYNRANRSLTHMTENFGSVLAGLALAGSVFPLPTLACACAFGLGRLVHQVGYSGGYGKHGLGFMISMLSSITLEGLCLVVALAGMGYLTVAAAPSPTVALEARLQELENVVAALKAQAA